MDKPKTRKNVVVFTSPSCGWCNALKGYLREKQVRFREVDVSRDANAAKELSRRGYRGVPVVFINNRPIVGFNKQEIDRLLKSK